MAKRFYTVLILPDATSPTRVLRISQTVLAALSSVSAVTILVLAFFLGQSASLHIRLLELKQFRRETTNRNMMAERVSQFEDELSRLRVLDKRLRVVMGMDRNEPPQVPLSQGGDDTVGRNALLEALKQGGGRFAESMERNLAALEQEISSRERSFRELKTRLDEKAAVLAATPTILPVRGLITCGYGYRKSPFTGLREFHEGLDIAASYGTPVLAAADGVVSFVGSLASYGNVVFIHHGHGFATFYGHNSANRIREGQQVHRGDIIAYLGTTGRTTGPHVHYAVYVKGALANPLTYVVDTEGPRFAGGTEARKPS